MSEEVVKQVCEINNILPVTVLFSTICGGCGFVGGFILRHCIPSWKDKKSDTKDSYTIYKEDKGKLVEHEAGYHTVLNDICDKLVQKQTITKDDYDNFIRKGYKYLSQAKTICVGCTNSHVFDDNQIQEFKKEIGELVNLSNIQKFYTVANLLRKSLSIKRTVMNQSNYQVILDFVES